MESRSKEFWSWVRTSPMVNFGELRVAFELMVGCRLCSDRFAGVLAGIADSTAQPIEYRNCPFCARYEAYRAE